MQRFGLMAKLITVALGVVIAVAALASADAQQEPPFRYYGDGTDGDTVVATDNMGNELGSDTVTAGEWYIDVDRDAAAGTVFTLNGEATTSELSLQTVDSAKVTLTVIVVEEPAAVDCPEDSMMEDDSMMEGDDDSMMEEDSMMESDDSMSEDCPDDSMMEEDGDDSMMEEDGDDSMMEEDDAMLDEDVGLPATGTGGLADNSGISAGLIGLLIALGTAAIAGLGIRRVRNRA